MSTYNIINEEVKQKSIEEIKQLPLGEHTITIKNKKETRSAAQLRLKWMWMGFLAKEKTGEGTGKDAKEWNRFFKEKYIKHFLIAQDEEYAGYFSKKRRVLQMVKASGTDKDFKFAKDELLDATPTEWLTVKNMKAYMINIQMSCSMDLGIQLPIPDDLKWLQE